MNPFYYTLKSLKILNEFSPSFQAEMLGTEIKPAYFQEFAGSNQLSNLVFFQLLFFMVLQLLRIISKDQ